MSTTDQPAAQVVTLLEGPLPPGLGQPEGRLLVTVFSDGTAEAAWRPSDQTRTTWSPPSSLDSRPT